jgi:hypothetical protein
MGACLLLLDFLEHVRPKTQQKKTTGVLIRKGFFVCD